MSLNGAWNEPAGHHDATPEPGSTKGAFEVPQKSLRDRALTPEGDTLVVRLHGDSCARLVGAHRSAIPPPPAVLPNRIAPEVMSAAKLSTSTWALDLDRVVGERLLARWLLRSRRAIADLHFVPTGRNSSPAVRRASAILPSSVSGAGSARPRAALSARPDRTSQGVLDARAAGADPKERPIARSAVVSGDEHADLSVDRAEYFPVMSV
jgi:hypothetical protein